MSIAWGLVPTRQASIPPFKPPPQHQLPSRAPSCQWPHSPSPLPPCYLQGGFVDGHCRGDHCPGACLPSACCLHDCCLRCQDLRESAVSLLKDILGPAPSFCCSSLQREGTFKGEMGSGKRKTSYDVHMEPTTLLCPFRCSGPEGIYKATRWTGAGGPREGW